MALKRHRGLSPGELVEEAWEKLPANGKPRVRPNGAREWTVIAGIVVETEEKSQCVALASGVKALPWSVVQKYGDSVIHDMHAEILALRAFNRYLLETHASGFRKIHLVVSHAPCGDASMSLIGPQWEGTAVEYAANSVVRGRSAPGMVGCVRTKPGRADSVKTLSKSCSDKLALKQINGLLCGVSRQVFEKNMYLTDLWAPKLPDFERAFERWDPQHRFEIHDLRMNSSLPLEGDVPCNTSIVWIPSTLEVVCKGIRQGAKMGTPKAQSAFSTRSLMELAGVDCVPKSGKFYPPGWARNAQGPDSASERGSEAPTRSAGIKPENTSSAPEQHMGTTKSKTTSSASEQRTSAKPVTVNEDKTDQEHETPTVQDKIDKT